MSAVFSASLIKGACTLRDTRYVTIACVVALLWDSFITISNEVLFSGLIGLFPISHLFQIDLIWVRVTQIGLIPTLYLANKYISIVTIGFGVYRTSNPAVKGHAHSTPIDVSALREPITVDVSMLAYYPISNPVLTTIQLYVL
jgi:Family of unknown function (DUF6533)